MKYQHLDLLRFGAALLLCCSFHETHAQGLPAFPGAEGFGRYVTGGRGGEVYRVTTLDDCSEDNLVAGTLRYGCRKAPNSTIVFDVSGTTHLTSELSLSASNVTIAGQSAPGDGICIADYPFTINANNVILRYLRFRLGNVYVENHEGDGLGGMDRSNVIVDHCSISWSVDECCSVYGIRNLTVQWCLIAQSMRESGHSKGAHGYGGNWGGEGATYHHNLLCHHESRTPRLGPRPSTQTKELLDMRNNVIYNWAGNGCYGGEGMNVNIVNNYYKPGPATQKKGGTVSYRIASLGVRTTAYCTSSINGTDTIWNGWAPMHHVWGKYFVDGNVIHGNEEVSRDNWTKGIYAQTTNGANVDYTWTQQTRDTIRLGQPHGFYPVTTHSAGDAYAKVLDHAGASLHRDSFDAQMVNDTRQGVATYGNSNGMPGIINTQDDLRPADAPADWSAWPLLATRVAPADSDGDGMPDSWEVANGLDPYDASDRNRVAASGYTMLETYLNSLVGEITLMQNEGGVMDGDDPEPDEASGFVLIDGGWNPSSALVSLTSTGNMNSKANTDAAAAIAAYDIAPIVGVPGSVSLGSFFDVITSVPCKFENNTYTITAQPGYGLSELHSIGYTAGDPKPTFGSVFRLIGDTWETAQSIAIPTHTNPNLASVSTASPALTSVGLLSESGIVKAVRITRGGRENACSYIVKLDKTDATALTTPDAGEPDLQITDDRIRLLNGVRIEVYALCGRICLQEAADELPIVRLPRGIYLAKGYRSAGQPVVRKFVR